MNTSEKPRGPQAPGAHGRVAAVVLAAGRSSRMGGPNKQLVLLNGEALIRHTVRRVVASGHDDVLVVLGRDAHDVRAVLSDLPVRFTVHPDFERGLASSFRAGIDDLLRSADVEAATFVLADMVLVTAEMYRAVLDAYLATRPPLVLATFGGVRAPPHLFRRDLWPHFGHEGDHGPKDLVRAYAAQAVTLDFPAWGLTDVDTPDDVAAVGRLLRATI